MASQSVRILNTTSLLRAARQLKEVGGPRLAQNMTRRVRRAAEPLQNDMRQTILGLQIQSQGRKAGKRGGPSPTRRPLRATIAGAVRTSVRTGSNPGARVWVDKDRLPHDLRNMASALNTGRVRHPVFGNRRRWAQQNTTPLWWDSTVAKHVPRMQSEVARILDDIRDQLT
ncbi:hypothetical protein [Streptomyces sp. NPDC008141]|uniref:hypothetical protein n=1 Tax=Streptomyces sp. NPDC008141 TaxID=3364815 RepID=UPI0036ED0430